MGYYGHCGAEVQLVERRAPVGAVVICLCVPMSPVKVTPEVKADEGSAAIIPEITVKMDSDNII